MKSGRHNILNVAPLASATGKYGGPFETSLSQARLAKTQFNVKVFAPHLHGDALEISEEFEIISPKISRYSGRNNFWITFSLASTRRLSREIRWADVVHLSFSREMFPFLAAVLALMQRKKLILQPHGMLTSRQSVVHRVLDTIAIPLVKASNQVVALTDIEAEQLLNWGGLKRSKLTVIGNPIPSFVPSGKLLTSNQSNVVRFIARLHPRKRVVDFAEAGRLHKEWGVDSKFVVTGPDQGELNALNPYILDSVIEYTGPIRHDEVPQLLAHSKVFVLTSQDEPWGNVLVTALALGVPVVLTKSSHLSNIVAAYAAGLVVNDHDPKDISTAVRILLEMPEVEYESYRINAVRLAREVFSNEIVTRKLNDLYELACS